MTSNTTPQRRPITDLRMKRTRRDLGNALVALLQRESLNKLTIRDIADEAEVGYATFFRHYASKEQLLEEIVHDEITRLLELAVPMLTPDDTYASCLTFCNIVYEHRTLWSALLSEGAASILRKEFLQLVMKYRSRKASYPSWLRTDVGVVFGVGATIELLGWWLQQPEELTPEEMAKVIDQLVVTPTVGAK